MSHHHHPRRILTPSESRKRKEVEALLNPRKPPSAPHFSAAKAAPPMVKAPADPAANRLLAGYMAHEFLTRGTLMGQRWDPARAEAARVSNGSREEAEPSRKGKLKLEAEKKKLHEDQKTYAEVARLLKEDGAHVAGIVNPTQLARWIQM